MKQMFSLYRRNGIYYAQNTYNGKQESLRTRDEATAKALLHSKNEASRQPMLTPLPITFEALEKAADNPATELPLEIYENLCWYCAFLWRVSPFAKAAAPADFVIQLDKDLENGRVDMLREVLGYPEWIWGTK